MKKQLLPTLFLVLWWIPLRSQDFRHDSLFNFDWKFQKGKIREAQLLDFDDSNWRTLDLPHDWSIEDLPVTDTSNGRIISGPFDSHAESGKHSGFTVGGTGWYRKHFKLSVSDTGKIVYINFDGIYMNYDIWINGHHIGNQPYGYTANWFDLTNYLNYGAKENVIAIEVKNEGINSRWYSGSGIYRDVTLSFFSKIHAKPWGIFVNTLSADSGKAKIKIETQIANNTNSGKDLNVLFEIFDSKSNKVVSKEIITYAHQKVLSHTLVNFTIDNPQLWSPDSPELYKVRCSLFSGNELQDKSETTFGIRTIEFDPEKGMFLNGKNIKLKGGAMHSNNGPLGACAYYRAEERRVELMKKCGFNAVRCAHNPPSKNFLDACDRLGILVIEEAFDVWAQGWLPDDYQRYFNEWWKHDVQNMVLRDRNHPCIFAWSIRNQVKEAKDSLAVATGREIAGFIRSIDPTRAITANITMFESWGDGDPNLWKLRDPFFENLDICGYSYQSVQFTGVHKRLPDRIQFSSEIDPLNCFKNWMRTMDNDFVIGNFTWTAMDFMGEVCLGWNSRVSFRGADSILFPWQSTYSGDIDLCGFRRPRSYYRDILFNTGKSLSIFVKSPYPSFEMQNNSRWGWEDVKPSWTWPGYEGDSLQVVVYSICDSVQLFHNGKYMGTETTNRSTEFKAYWHVPYEMGELMAIGYINGIKDASIFLHTTSEPYSIRLTADKNKIIADNQDLCYVTVEIVDKNNNVVPYADNFINFEVEGKGKGTIAGVGSGNPVSPESFQQPYRKAYEGKCILILKSTDTPGTISVIAKSKGLKSGKLKIATDE